MSSVPRCLLGLALSALLLAAAGPARAQQADEDGEAAMLERINALRAEAGVGALIRDPRLDAAARTHSVDMAWHQMVEHVSPRTGTPADRVGATGVEASGLAENVSFNQSAAGAQQGLEASPPHKQNMLAAGMTHVGISVVFADGGVYATQVYATLAEREETAEDARETDEETEPAGEAEEQPLPTMPPPAPVPAPAPPPPPVAEQPQQPQSSQPIAVSNGQRITGYWVHSAGRWYYYPMPPNARPGQRLQPDLSVTGGPPAAVLRRHQQQQGVAVQAPPARRAPVQPPPPAYRWRVRL